MRYADLVTMYFERSTALQNYWTLYVVVIGGLLAVAAIRQRPDVPAGLLVTVLYASFAYKNLGAIHDATVQRLALLDAIHRHVEVAPIDPNLSPTRTLLEPTLTPPAYPGVRNFHVGCDVLTIITLWTLQYRRWRHTTLRTASPLAGNS